MGVAESLWRKRLFQNAVRILEAGYGKVNCKIYCMSLEDRSLHKTLNLAPNGTNAVSCSHVRKAAMFG
jgi:hypothetical protein